MRVAMGDFVCENNAALSDKRLSELWWRWARLVCRMVTSVRFVSLCCWPCHFRCQSARKRGTDIPN